MARVDIPCTYCSQPISANAIKCWHCYRFLDAPEGSKAPREGLKTRTIVMLIGGSGLLFCLFFAGVGALGAYAASQIAPARGALNPNTQWIRDLKEQTLGTQVEAIPSLIAALTHADSDVRSEAARFLGNLGSEGAIAIPNLQKTLQDKDKYVRGNAATALGQIGPEAAVAIPDLKRIIEEDPEASTRAAAIGAVGGLGSEAQSLYSVVLQALSDLDPQVRARAASSLARVTPEDVNPTDTLLPLLKDENADVRRETVNGLGALDQKAKDALPELRRLLRDDPDQYVRQAAVTQIGRLDAAGNLTAIQLALQDDYKWTRSAACYALARAHEQAAPAVPHLIVALSDSESWVCVAASHALSQIGPEAAKAVPGLRKNATDPRDDVRLAAVRALAALGPPAEPAIPELAKARTDLKPDIQLWATFALGEVRQDETAISALRQAVSGADEALRSAAFGMLHRMKERAAPALPELLSALAEPGGKPERGAIRALGQIGPQAAEALPRLIEILGSKNETKYARRDVAHTLFQIGPTPDAIPNLLAALHDGYAPLRKTAVKALVKLGEPAVPGLTAKLTDEAHWVRASAAEALGELGPLAEPAVEALTVASKDSFASVRRAADEALEKIRAPKEEEGKEEQEE